MSEPLFLRTLKGEKVSEVPIWFMRQAGRYLPEYRKIRKKFSNFLEFCYSPNAACEVTLQPIERFGFDAAIIFSDILVIPDALGQTVRFVKGEGPKLESLEIDRLSLARVQAHLQPVAESLRLTRNALGQDKALIGFSGCPWTLFCYMVEGGGSRDFAKARQSLYREKSQTTALFAMLEQAIVAYCQMQIHAGADCIMLFDSWAGVLSCDECQRWAAAPTARIVKQIKQAYPHTPIILFPKGIGANLPDYLSFLRQENYFEALGLDHTTPRNWAKKQLTSVTLQGNLSNIKLAESQQDAVKETREILQDCKDIPFIFNLGHGILPHTPIEHVQSVVETVKGWRRDL